jgi:GDP-L-fucose synthase
MQKALILGSTSFFGKHFIQKINKMMKITCLNSKSCDLLTNKIYEYKEEKYDYIFYFSVKTEAGGYCQRHPGEQYLINQSMNTRVLDYWKKIQPQAKFITFGTSCSYSDDIIKKEENYLLGSCESGYEVYGMTKRMLLVGLKAMASEYDMKYLFFVPSCFYGTHYKQDDKHFIYDLIRKICEAKHNNAPPPILWGNGNQKRELIYVDDAVDIVFDSLNKNNEIINLSSKYCYSIKRYAKIICNIVDYDFSQIQFDVTKFVGAHEKSLVTEKIKDYCFTTPKDGLKSVSSYYMNNYMAKK